MSAVGDALKALKSAILLEERMSAQAKKVEQLALSVVEIDKRLAALEGRMEGFLAGVAAFGGRARPAKKTEAPARHQQWLCRGLKADLWRVRPPSKRRVGCLQMRSARCRFERLPQFRSKQRKIIEIIV
jgi:hypothetical protein